MIEVETAEGRIPALGFGTWRLRDAQAQKMVETALAVGYRHVDTAQAYGNEREVGAGVAASGVPREAIWLTTKIWPDSFAGDALRRAAEASVERLGTIPDLLLLHWPSASVPLEETIDALNAVREQGHAHEIGVSNFPVALLEKAAGLSAAPLVANQVEYHPFLDQDKVLAACRGHRMALTAYCPIARGRVFDDPTIKAVAERHGRTPAQVTLRWLVQQEGVCAIPKTASEANARANFAIFDFELGADEMEALHALASPQGRICQPPGDAVAWD